ncbi:hypothetical protein JB92DRAFT_3118022 [Gautieria morchelliformis]|nr:hypothetical protein JB92DRAFT_3118022 [Gautieria morchelliformis]
MPSGQCSALANAQAAKGMSYAQIAAQIGSTEQQVSNICTGAATPSQAEFNAIAQVLGLTTAPSHPHATR